MASGVHFIVVFNHIPALIATVEANSRRAPKRVADKVAVRARALAPVDTGFLKSTIMAYSVESGKTAEVIVGASYAGYVEYGTYKMAAQPFLYPATMYYSDEFMMEVAKPVFGIKV